MKYFRQGDYATDAGAFAIKGDIWYYLTDVLAVLRPQAGAGIEVRMHKRQSKVEFVTLLLFLTVATLLLTNGFVARIFAQGKDVDVYSKVQPIGEVLNTILDEYVRDPDVDKVVEGALVGMMNSLDKHSSYISAEILKQMKDETRGEFEGIGVNIHLDEQKNIVVVQPLADSPAAKSGVLKGDIIAKIDGVSTSGMALEEASKRIKGPRGEEVRLTLYRRHDDGEMEMLELAIKRGPIPLDSIKETRILQNGIGYIRISDFKDNTARDLGKNISKLQEQGMTSLVLDLRWNPGGLLTASKEVSELFLPKNTLVTYTEGRKVGRSDMTEDMKFYTDRAPILPRNFPLIVLINKNTASSAEIVTGALQYWKNALVVGEETYGKGSVQTIIPLVRPEGSALRLTTALYYTPAGVTIDGTGIKPDVQMAMEEKQQFALLKQMFESVKDDAKKINEQNHGSVSGDKVEESTVEDLQLKRAVELLIEEPQFDRLLTKYHKDTSETQVAASPDKVLPQGRDAQKDDSDITESEATPAPETAP